jgi:hypothetical protein
MEIDVWTGREDNVVATIKIGEVGLSVVLTDPATVRALLTGLYKAGQRGERIIFTND